MKETTKVAIVYHFLGHYREPVFRLLCQQQDEIEYVFFSDRINTLNSVKTIDPRKASLPIDQGGLRWRFVKNKLFFKNILWQKGLLRMLYGKEFDTIIYLGSVHFISTWVSAALARLTGKRVLMWSHGFLRDEKGVKGWVRKSFYRLANGMLLYHNRAKQILIRKGFNPENLYVIYNSLDYDEQIKIRKQISDRDKSLCRQNLFKNHELPVLLFIGRLTESKQLDLLIQSVRVLSVRGQHYNILFVGDGPEKARLQEIAMQFSLVDNLCFYGPCYDESKIALLISASDICVAPGEVGLTCMHSLVYGTPVITHDNPDLQMPEYEAITPGYNGAFFKKNDFRDLANTIEKWMAENKDDIEVRKKCFKIIDEVYNPHYQLKVLNEAVLGKPSLDKIF